MSNGSTVYETDGETCHVMAHFLCVCLKKSIPHYSRTLDSNQGLAECKSDMPFGSLSIKEPKFV